MELVFIACLGTFVIMAVELHEFIGRRTTGSLTVPSFASVYELRGRTAAQRSAIPAEEVYDAAA
jgi:hypothetical protein